MIWGRTSFLIPPKKCDLTLIREKACFLAKTSLSSYPFGGDKRDRTADLLNAIQALSQLSYTPSYITGYEIFGCQFWAAQWGLVKYDTRSQLGYTPSYITGYEIFGCQLWSTQWGLVKYGTRSQLSYTPKPAAVCSQTARGILAKKTPLVNAFFLSLPPGKNRKNAA